MPTQLSKRVLGRVEATFAPDDREFATAALAAFGAKFTEIYQSDPTDRVFLAAIKLSGGSRTKLQANIRLGLKDWRDLLSAAE